LEADRLDTVWPDTIPDWLADWVDTDPNGVAPPKPGPVVDSVEN
jgi:hypothetical protein